MKKNLLMLLTLLFAVVGGANASITVKWDWQNNIPSATIRTFSEINGTTGSVASDQDGITLYVDATNGKLASRGENQNNAQINANTILQIPVVSTADQVTISLYSSYEYTIDGTSYTNSGDTYTATVADVARGYMEFVQKADGYIYYIHATLAYVPVAPLTAVWDWKNGNPSTITNSTPEGTNASGSIASSISSISLEYKAVTSSDYAKLQYRSGNHDAHFYTGTEIHVPVSSIGDVVTIVSNSNYYNYTVGGTAASAIVTKHQATAGEVATGYVAIIATSDSYLYSISLEKHASLTITNCEWATYSNAGCALDFANPSAAINAYMVTGADGTAITKSEPLTGTVPANTGLLINGAAGTYAIPVVASSTTDVSTNLLKPGTGEEVAYNANDGFNYVLALNSLNKPMFQHIVSGTPATVPVGKAYLALTNNPAGAPWLSIIGDEDDTTGIDVVRGRMEEVRGVFYDLSGRRVENPTKGLFIVNGKKVIIK